MIEIIDEFGSAESCELAELLEQVVDFAVKQVLGEDEVELTVTLTDGETIREINKEHRGIDSETDVLSFPLWDRRAGEEPFINPDTDAIMLGDIIISIPRMKEQAEEYGHSERRELAYLCIHGVLHLLGYDHIEENDKTEMRGKEEELLSALRLTRED